MNDLARDVLLIAISFLCGSLPFSLWLARLASGKDIRTVGDGNPGATNVFKAGGSKAWGIAAVLLDIFKALIPVGYAYWFVHPPFWAMLAIALAPIIGHAYSPFLGFKGGKAIASTGGSWIALTVYDVPVVGGLMLFYWYKSFKVSGWAVMGMMGGILLYILLTRSDPLLFAFWLCNTTLLAWKHRDDLRRAPGLRRWLPIPWRKDQAA
jgi:acyl phosphate:glycerol-3-phosphate acyltransferase